MLAELAHGRFDERPAKIPAIMVVIAPTRASHVTMTYDFIRRHSCCPKATGCKIDQPIK